MPRARLRLVVVALAPSILVARDDETTAASDSSGGIEGGSLAIS